MSCNTHHSECRFFILVKQIWYRLLCFGKTLIINCCKANILWCLVLSLNLSYTVSSPWEVWVCTVKRIKCLIYSYSYKQDRTVCDWHFWSKIKLVPDLLYTFTWKLLQMRKKMHASGKATSKSYPMFYSFSCCFVGW